MSEQNSRFNYIKIQIELIACPFFTYKEKEIISEIINISDKYLEKGGCSRTNKNLAFRHRTSASKISNVITTANRLGFVINREDEVHKRKSETGRSTLYSTERKIIMRLPEEWQIMGDLYNGAFVKEDMEMYRQFILIENELKQIDPQDITQEKVKEILFKHLDSPPYLKISTPPNRKKSPPILKNLPAIYKGENNKRENNKKTLCQKISPESIISLWNKLAKENELPSISKLTPSRKSKILSRCKSSDLSSSADWEKLFDKIPNCPFLLGDGNTGWKVSFDWLVHNDENYVKVLEGLYDEKKKKTPKRIGTAKPQEGKYKNLLRTVVDNRTGRVVKMRGEEVVEVISEGRE